MPTDTERLDWLQTQATDIHFKTIRESIPGSNDRYGIEFRRGNRVQLFTIASQHVYGRDLRDAIDVAMRR